MIKKQMEEAIVHELALAIQEKLLREFTLEWIEEAGEIVFNLEGQFESAVPTIRKVETAT